MYDYSFDGVLRVKAYVDAMEAMEKGYERDAELEAKIQEARSKK